MGASLLALAKYIYYISYHLLSFNALSKLSEAAITTLLEGTLTSCQQHSWKYSFTCWSILVNQL